MKDSAIEENKNVLNYFFCKAYKNDFGCVLNSRAYLKAYLVKAYLVIAASWVISTAFAIWVLYSWVLNGENTFFLMLRFLVALVGFGVLALPAHYFALDIKRRNVFRMRKVANRLYEDYREFYKTLLKYLGDGDDPFYYLWYFDKFGVFCAHCCLFSSCFEENFNPGKSMDDSLLFRSLAQKGFYKYGNSDDLPDSVDFDFSDNSMNNATVWGERYITMPLSLHK